MNITKEELQKIIIEELEAVLDEEQIEEKKGSKRQRKKKAKKKSNKICAKGIAWAKRTFDTYPSAYANLAASKYCKDPNYGKGRGKDSKNESLNEGELQKWVDEDWVRVTSSGKIAGKCGSSKDKKNPDRCLPRSKAQGMSKGERAATGKKKKDAQKSGKDSGKSSYVSNTKKGKVTKASRKDESLYEAEITDDERKELEDVSKQLKGAVKAHGKQAATIDKALKKEGKKNCGCGQDPCKTYGIQEQVVNEEELEEKKKKKKACKPSKGKRFAKRVNGKCRSFGQKGKAKGGGDRIRPGTKKGDAYCARSAKIKKCKNPPCANDLSRKKWKCRGSKSMRE